jgi:hypothetical protein
LRVDGRLDAFVGSIVELFVVLTGQGSMCSLWRSTDGWSDPTGASRHSSGLPCDSSLPGSDAAFRGSD